MIQVNFIVEGPTEETFVKHVLSEYLCTHSITVNAGPVRTGGLGSKSGGMTTFARAEKDIHNWLKQQPDAYVTTMFDLYKLPRTFPGWEDALKTTDKSERVRLLERRLSETIGHRKFIPYIQLHEFETLLFSDTQVIDDVLTPYSGSHLTALREDIASFSTPEEINDGETTAPSKRILALYKRYNKIIDGIDITAKIGVERIREKCQHFSKWLDDIIAVAQ